MLGLTKHEQGGIKIRLGSDFELGDFVAQHREYGQHFVEQLIVRPNQILDIHPFGRVEMQLNWIGLPSRKPPSLSILTQYPHTSDMEPEIASSISFNFVE